MKTNWQTKKEMEANFYYLMKDILSCFPNNFENNFLGIINHHFIAKETTRKILIDEAKKKKSDFKILTGALILQNAFLKQSSRGALYEVIDIVEQLKICSKSKLKTIKKLSTQVILKLFVTLYFEYVIMPGRKEEGKEFLNKFKNYFSAKDIVNLINIDRVSTRFLFERCGIEVGFGKEMDKRFNKILDNFYK